MTAVPGNEVSLMLEICKIILKQVRKKIPDDRTFAYSYIQFKIARRTNPKLIFNNLGTYLLAPFASVIQTHNLRQLLNTIMSSQIYSENKKEYEDLISNMVFKPIRLFTEEECTQMMRNVDTMLQLYIAYYERKGKKIELNKEVVLSLKEMSQFRSSVNEVTGVGF